MKKNNAHALFFYFNTPSSVIVISNAINLDKYSNIAFSSVCQIL